MQKKLWAKILCAAVLTGSCAALLCSSPTPVRAAEIKYDIEKITSKVGEQNKPMFNLYFAQPFGEPLDENDNLAYSRGFSAAIRSTIKESGQYWADMLAPGSKNTQPVAIRLCTLDDANASGASFTFDKDFLNEKYRNLSIIETVLQKDFPAGFVSDGNSFSGEYNLGYMGTPSDPDDIYSAWYVNTKTQVPDAKALTKADLAGCSRHELAHGLGVGGNYTLMIWLHILTV